MTAQTGLSYAQYADLPGLRSSHLSALAQSPLHYRRPKPRKTDSTELRLIHALALEGEEAASAAFVCAHGTRSSKDAKTLAAVHGADAVATAAEWTRARACAAALHEHAIIGPLLESGEPEVTVTWTRPDGRACKARFDWLTFKIVDGVTTAYLLDLKGYGSTAAHHVARQAAKLGAHTQAAHYREGLILGYGWTGPIRQGLIVYETSDPFDAALFWFTPDAIESATAAREALIDRLAECERSGVWPGRYTEPQELERPWEYNDDNDDTEASFTITED